MNCYTITFGNPGKEATTTVQIMAASEQDAKVLALREKIRTNIPGRITAVRKAPHLQQSSYE